MVIMIEMIANRFTDKDSRILHIDTKEVIEDESEEIVKQIEDQTTGLLKNC